MSYLPAILLMAAITFSVRYVFFSSTITIDLSENVKTFLTFTGPCVLAAMTSPIIFSDYESSVFVNPYFVGGLVTLALSLWVKKTILVVLFGMFTFFLFSTVIN